MFKLESFEAWATQRSTKSMAKQLTSRQGRCYTHGAALTKHLLAMSLSPSLEAGILGGKDTQPALRSGRKFRRSAPDQRVPLMIEFQQPMGSSSIAYNNER